MEVRVYLGYLSEQFLEGLPDTHQPNVVEKAGHKPRWRRAGGEEGKGKEGGARGGGGKDKPGTLCILLR